MEDKYLHGVIHAVDVAPGYEYMHNVPNPNYIPHEKRKTAVTHGFGSYTLGSRSNLDGDVGAVRTYDYAVVASQKQQASQREYALNDESVQQMLYRLADERDFWRREAIQRGYRDGRGDR